MGISLDRDYLVSLNWHTGYFVYSDDEGKQTLISRDSPKAATFDSIPGILTVIAHPGARFFEVVNIGMPAQGTYSIGIFPFVIVRRLHSAPERKYCCP